MPEFVGYLVAIIVAMAALVNVEYNRRRTCAQVNELRDLIGGAQRRNLERLMWLDRKTVDHSTQMSALSDEVSRIRAFTLGPPSIGCRYPYQGKSLAEKINMLIKAPVDQQGVVLPVLWVHNGKREKEGPRERNVSLRCAVTALYNHLGLEMKFAENDASEEYTCYKPRRKR